MSDLLTPQQRHICMSHIRSKNTKPEIRLRRELFGLGYRYRINVRKLPGTPDIVLAKYRTCIFVNGCFWHGHQNCRKFVLPKANAEFWKNKIGRNRERDLADHAYLESLGWRVIVVWECEIGKAVLPETMEKLQMELENNRDTWMAEVADRKHRKEEWREEIRRRNEREKELWKDIQEKLSAKTSTQD